MGISFGGSNKTITQNTQTTTNPWDPAIPQLKDFLAKLNGTSTSVTPTQTDAFNTLEANAANGNPAAAQTRQISTDLMNSPDRTGVVNDAYSTMQGNLGDYASGKYLDVANNPQIQALMKTVGDDIQTRVNQQFAAAGRDMSGMNQQAVSRGISQATAPILLNEFNTQQQNQLNANNSLYGAGASTASTNANLDATRAAIQGAGVNMSDTALAQENYAPTTMLNLEQQKNALPFTNLGMLANLLFPAAGLGGTSSGTGTANSSGVNYGANLNLLSDERAKENKEEVGTLHDGTPIYKYNYKGDPTTRVGPMAQDVEQRAPEAVSDDGPGGLKTVNMDLATRKAAQIAKERVAAKRKRA